jgi:hypothetical protein
MFFIEVDKAEVCKYDVVGSLYYFKAFKIVDNFLSRGKVLF